jgi:hypothetical protein
LAERTQADLPKARTGQDELEPRRPADAASLVVEKLRYNHFGHFAQTKPTGKSQRKQRSKMNNTRDGQLRMRSSTIAGAGSEPADTGRLRDPEALHCGIHTSLAGFLLKRDRVSRETQQRVPAGCQKWYSKGTR